MRRPGAMLAGLIGVTLAAAGCIARQRIDEGTHCATTNLSGALEDAGRLNSQTEVRNVTFVTSGGADGTMKDDNGQDTKVRIDPACESHKFKVGHLSDGRFVARITIEPGKRVSRFSKLPGDIVYWWVYLDLGTKSLRSQFLSANATTDQQTADWLQQGSFDYTCLAVVPQKERASWEEKHDTKPCTKGQPRGDRPVSTQIERDDVIQPTGLRHNPWFACFVGCCQSS
jgi:hypothetical protein